MDIVKRNSGKEDWWTGSAPSGPFIYTPFSKGDTNSNSRQELIWVVGEPGLVISDPFCSSGSPTSRNVSVLNISVVPSLPLLASNVGGDGVVILYEGEIRDVCISLANADTAPVEQAHISLSVKNQDAVTSIAYENLKSSLPLKPGSEITLPVTIRASGNILPLTLILLLGDLGVRHDNQKTGTDLC